MLAAQRKWTGGLMENWINGKQQPADGRAFQKSNSPSLH
jgi:hypothetical protein